MPNTLAHFGVQAVAGHGLFRRMDPRWVLVGAILPDVPWILYRLAGALSPPLDPYQLRLFAIVQASLLCSLLLAASVAALARRPVRVFAVLALGVVVHLLLDAAQTKWGSGVQLLAPWSWETVNLGWFWPESAWTLGLTAAGVAYAVWVWRQHPWRRPALALSPARVTAAAGVFGLYLLLAAAFSGNAATADPHFVATLRHTEARVGSRVEFDRTRYIAPAGTGTGVLSTFAGERIHVRGVEGGPGTVSVRGRFVARDTILATDVHRHAGTARDLASVFGLGFLALVVLRAWPRIRRRGEP